jgi:hypothetical protein
LENNALEDSENGADRSETESIKDEFRSFIASWPRVERYDWAGMTFRLSVYQWLERYVTLNFLAFLVVPWVPVGTLHDVILGAVWLLPIIGVAHYGYTALTQPWTVLRAAVEAGILWALYHWLVSPFFSLPHFSEFCVFIFVARFWQRGERDVNVRAFQAYDAAKYEQAKKAT